MQLLDPSPRRPPGIQRTFGASSAAILVWLLVGLASAAGFGFVVRIAAHTFHGTTWILAGPILLACGAALLLVLLVGVGAFRASLRESNWILGVARDGLFLNLRSYLNAAPDAPERTVAFIGFSEIASARKTVERWDVDLGGESTTQLHAFLELSLTGVDTAPLAEIVRLEAARVPPQRSFLGVRVRTKVHDRPVFVEEPGIVRVRWKRGMLPALEGRVRIEPRRTVRREPDATSLLDLVRRGERMTAIQVVQQGKVRTLAEARQLVEDVERRG